MKFLIYFDLVNKNNEKKRKNYESHEALNPF